MWLTRPFVELFHELVGTPSSFHRQTAETLRRLNPPRTAAAAEAVAELHAPWWGFAAWGAVYAMTVMMIVALLVAAVFEVTAKRLGMADRFDWTVYFWAGAVLSAPVSFLPFRRWMRRRRRDLVKVARDGMVVSGEITQATVVKVRGGLSLKGAAHSTHMTIKAEGSEPGTFQGFVAKGPAWVAPGQRVEIVSLPASSYAVLLCPDGGTRPLKRAGMDA